MVEKPIVMIYTLRRSPVNEMPSAMKLNFFKVILYKSIISSANTNYRNLYTYLRIILLFILVLNGNCFDI